MSLLLLFRPDEVAPELVHLGGVLWPVIEPDLLAEEQEIEALIVAGVL